MPPPMPRSCLITMLALLAACSAAGGTGTGTGTDPAPAPTASSIAEPPTTTAPGEECENERRMLEVATEAYVAKYGTVPPDEPSLVASGMLRGEIEPYDLTKDGVVVRVSGVACPAHDDADTAVGDAGDTADEAGGETGGEADRCTAERQTLEVAAEAYEAMLGATPITQQDLVDAGLISQPSAEFDLVAGAIVPVPGSSCEAVGAPKAAESAEDCSQAMLVLEVAVEAHVAQHGGPPADQQALVDRSLLRVPYTDFTVAPDGAITPVPGSICAQVP